MASGYNRGVERSAGVVVLLDVDGVVSRLSSRSRVSSRLRLDADVAGRVRRLRSLAEVVWVTAWDAGTRGAIEGTFGLPRLRAVEVARGVDALDAVRGWLDRSAPADGWRVVAWIDDVLLGDAVAWAESVPFAVELVRPDGQQGLQDPHVDRVEAFLAAARHD